MKKVRDTLNNWTLTVQDPNPARLTGQTSDGTTVMGTLNPFLVQPCDIKPGYLLESADAVYTLGEPLPPVTIPPLTPHDPNLGDVMTAEDWEDAVNDGAFIHSDGCGNWATAEGYSDDDNDVFGPKPEWATHVAWFNK